MTQPQFTILMATIAGIVSTFSTLFVSIYRENRNRRWDLEDRRVARENSEAQLKAANVELQKKLDAQTEDLKHVARLEAELTRARAERIEADLRAETILSRKRVEAVEQHVVQHGTDIKSKLQHIGEALENVRLHRPRRSTDTLPTLATAEVLSEVRAIRPVVDETLEVVKEAAKNGDPGAEQT